MNKTLTSTAVLRFDPDYILPWLVFVVFSDGSEHVIDYCESKERARLTRDKWNVKESN